MAKTYFLIGGARSGKSSYAEELSKKISKKVAYLATSQIIDEEWEKRVAVHRQRRPHFWRTYEFANADITAGEFSDIYDTIIRDKNEVVLLDCITLLIFRLMHRYDFNDMEILDNALEKKIEEDVVSFFDACIEKIKSANIDCVIVSNEVGLGIVPPYPLGRIFRDIIGIVNMKIADFSDEVFFFVAGICQKIK
jgi:adenosylcobinamide kinase / adenosylcobinamide-phosphate guanylyltransferase